MMLRPIFSFAGISAGFIAATFVAIACSGGSTSAIANNSSDSGTADAAETGSGISATKATNDVGTAICARYNACSPAFITLAYGSLANCSARVPLSLSAGLGAAGSDVTPDELEACALAIPATSCADLVGRNLPAACQPTAGTLADGAACAADSQCLNKRCKVAADDVCGTCTSRASVGAACGVDDDCVNSAACVNSACVAYGNTGDSCSTSLPCNGTLGCVGGKCGTPGQTDAICTDSTACDELHGYFCNPISSKCEDVTFAGESQSCGLTGDDGGASSALVLCTGPGSLCNGLSATSAKGTCIAPAADNESCNATSGPACAAPAVCVDGICTIADPAECQ